MMTSRKITRDVKVVYDKEAVTMDTTTNGSQFNVQNFVEMLIFVETENSGGTSPTLDIKVQTKDPKQGNWFDAGIALTQITGDSTQMKANTLATYGVLIPLGQFCRLVYTIGGTSPTFDVTATVVLKS